MASPVGGHTAVAFALSKAKSRPRRPAAIYASVRRTSVTREDE
jgi:hypothetical protein